MGGESFSKYNIKYEFIKIKIIFEKQIVLIITHNRICINMRVVKISDSVNKLGIC